jgi:hypothetical protein
MATYVIAFRLQWGADYSDRWSSVMKAIRNQAIGQTWEELTSLVVLQTIKSADEVASSIYINSALNAITDTLLVVNVDNGTYATRGKIDEPAKLATLFSKNVLAGAWASFKP